MVGSTPKKSMKRLSAYFIHEPSLPKVIVNNFRMTCPKYLKIRQLVVQYSPFWPLQYTYYFPHYSLSCHVSQIITSIIKILGICGILGISNIIIINSTFFPHQNQEERMSRKITSRQHEGMFNYYISRLGGEESDLICLKCLYLQTA